MTTKPYQFQLEGVQQIDRLGGRVILADDLGLGKTLTSLLYAQKKKGLRPIIVCCPMGLKTNWKREAHKHLGMHGVILNTTKPNADPNILRSCPLIIINHDILKDWVDVLIQVKPKLLIIDESHNFRFQVAKQLPTQRTRALFKLHKEARIKRVIAISATPMTDRPYDIWPICHLLKPKIFNSMLLYGMRYCNLQKDDYGQWNYRGASNLKELHHILKKTILVRRTKKQVALELPPTRRIVLPIEITNRERYETADKEFHSWIIARPKNDLKGKDRSIGLEKITYMLQLTATLKLPLIREWIDNFLASDDGKLTVYGIHRKIVESLHETYSESVLVHGGITGKKRQNAVDKFQKDKHTRLFFGNMKAAGVGLTLTAAATGVLIEFGWTPGDHLQAEGRINRIGQTKNTTMYWLVGRDTIEEKLIKVLQTKQRNIDAAIDGAGDANTLDVYDMLIDELRKEHTPTKRKKVKA